MKKSFFVGMGVALVAALCLSSCAGYTSSAPVMSMTNGVNTYVEADLDYNNAKRVEGYVETKTLFGFIQLVRNGNRTLNNTTRYRGLSRSERQALYRAKESGRVDIIVEPEFEKEKHSWFFGAYKTTKTKATGWGLNVRGLKNDEHGNRNQTNTAINSGGLF